MNRTSKTRSASSGTPYLNPKLISWIARRLGSAASPSRVKIRSRSSRSDRSLVSMTTSASLRTGSSRRRSAAIELAIPRWSASGWRWRVSEKRRIRTSSRASRKKPAAGSRVPRARRASPRRPSARRPSGRRARSRPCSKRSGSSDDELGELDQELARQVVDDGVAEVLEQLRRGGLAAARQPAQEDDVLALASRRLGRSRTSAGRSSRRTPRITRSGPVRQRPLRRIARTVSSNSTYIVTPRTDRADQVAAGRRDRGEDRDARG